MSENKMYKTDVEVCGGYVLVTVDDWDERENGRLDIYRRYDKVTDEMELIHSIIGIGSSHLYKLTDGIQNEPAHEIMVLIT